MCIGFMFNLFSLLIVFFLLSSVDKWCFSTYWSLSFYPSFESIPIAWKSSGDSISWLLFNVILSTQTHPGFNIVFDILSTHGIRAHCTLHDLLHFVVKLFGFVGKHFSLINFIEKSKLSIRQITTEPFILNWIVNCQFTVC